MTGERHTLIAFMATLGSILALAALASFSSARDAQWISAVLTGLIGVLGTFRPRNGGMSDQTAQTLADKVPPVTTTGDPT